MTTETTGFLPIGTRIGEYEITSILGQGGFGITYKAWDHTLECDVAIKEYFPKQLASRDSDTISIKTTISSDQNAFVIGLKSFVKEAQVLAKFQHPAIVPVKRLVQANDTAYMIMGFVEGESLADYLHVHKNKVDPKTLSKWTKELLSGLRVVHAQGLLHRDIKPGNVYIKADGGAMLLDFGAARQSAGEASMSVTGLFTAGYSPPEQYSDRTTNQGPWSDIYALSATLYRCVKGKKPAAAPDRTESIHEEEGDLIKVLTPKNTRGYDAGFLSAINRGLDIRRTKRLQSVEEFEVAMSSSGKTSAATNNTTPTKKADSAKKGAAGKKAAGTKKAGARGVTAGGNSSSAGVSKPASKPALSTRRPVESLFESGESTSSAQGRQKLTPLKTAGLNTTKTTQVSKGKSKPSRPLSGSATKPAATQNSVGTQRSGASANTISSSSKGGEASSSWPFVFIAIVVLIIIIGLTTNYQSATPVINPDPVNPAPSSEAETARLWISTNVDGAKVFLRDEPAHVTYYDGIPLAKTTHRIRILANGYEPVTTTVDLRVRTRWSFTLAPSKTTPAQLGITLANIPAGSFRMGDMTGNGDSNEKPVRAVSVSGFKLMTTEVTWNHYQPCIDAGVCMDPKDKGWGRGDRPVIYVSWNTVQTYINWLEEQTGLSWRLPSEAEWEYAARAGTTTDYNWNSNSIAANQANYDESGNGKTVAVGRYPANRWGLYDMHGNVWEWTQDCWNESYQGAPSDGETWERGDCSNRVMRGGAWVGSARGLSSSYRYKHNTFSGFSGVGFRLVQGQ